MNLTTTKFFDTLEIEQKKFDIVSLDKAEKLLNFKLENLPFSYRVLLNLIRKIDDLKITENDIDNLINQRTGKEILFSPSRVLMQDYTGVPAVADLAAMRDKVKSKGQNPEKVNPVVPVSLIIDHSINVDSNSQKNSLFLNVKKRI